MQIHRSKIAVKLRQMQQQSRGKQQLKALRKRQYPCISEQSRGGAAKLAVNQQRAAALRAGRAEPGSRRLMRRDLLQAKYFKLHFIYCTCEPDNRHVTGEANPFLVRLKPGESQEGKISPSIVLQNCSATEEGENLPLAKCIVTSLQENKNKSFQSLYKYLINHQPWAFLPSYLMIPPPEKVNIV